MWSRSRSNTGKVIEKKREIKKRKYTRNLKNNFFNNFKIFFLQ